MAPAASSGPPSPELSGMVWERHGDWHLNGSPTALRLGEAIPRRFGHRKRREFAALDHYSLPDGQRMLCECYEAKTCSQGFRIPAITPQPRPAVWDMFVGVRNALLLRPATAETAFPTPAGRAAMAGNFEIVAAVNPQGEISIAPVLRVLPPGQYSLSITRDGQQTPVNPPGRTTPGLGDSPGASASPCRRPWTLQDSRVRSRVRAPNRD